MYFNEMENILKNNNKNQKEKEKKKKITMLERKEEADHVYRNY